MKLLKSLAAAALLLNAFGNCTYAQVLECDPEAFKNRDQGSMSLEYRAAFLKAIDETKFNQIKSSSSGGGGFNIAGISLGANASYDEFSQKREQLLLQLNYQESVDQALNYVRNSFDGPGAQAYNACVAAHAADSNNRGLFMWIRDPTDAGVTVRIHWRPTPVSLPARVRARDFQVSGSDSSLESLPRIWAPDSAHELILTRRLNEELRFTGAMRGSAASIFVPKKPILTPPVEERRCESYVLASRNAQASHGSLTDGVVGSSSPGQNSGNPRGSFWVEFAQPEWVHHLVLHPFGIGTTGTGTIVGNTIDGTSRPLTTFQTVMFSPPYPVYVDVNQSKDIKRVVVSTTSANGRDWWAFTEIEVFVCR